MALIDDCVHYYKFDTSNATQPDEVGSTDASVTNATFDSSGKINGDYTYNGTTAYMSTADLNIDISGSWSVSFWAFSSTTSSRRCLFSTSRTSSNALNIEKEDAANKLRVIGEQGGVNNVFILSDAALPTAAYFHVVVTRDGTTTTIYINGVAQADTSTGALSDISSTFYFGKLHSNILYWPGNIDEMAIFDADIGSAGVTELYNSGDGLQYPFTSGPDFTKVQVNIADAWKEAADMKINIGDDWKDVAAVKINVGDDWKDVL